MDKNEFPITVEKSSPAAREIIKYRDVLRNEVIFCTDKRTAVFSRMAKRAERQQIDVTVAVKLRDWL